MIMHVRKDAEIICAFHARRHSAEVGFTLPNQPSLVQISWLLIILPELFSDNLPFKISSVLALSEKESF